ncbi:MAG: ribonuclease [Oscillospiraceae bacterium]|nr:ribonuclease [Oscillospiraceae bacterium]
MKQKIISFLLVLSAVTLSGCAGLDAVNDVVQLPELTQTETLPDSRVDIPDGAALEDPGTSAGDEDVLWNNALPDEAALDEEGTYNSKEDVSLYLHLYEHLPSNYLTKSEARELGWTGGSVEKYAPGCAIGGDRFGNREGLLPEEPGRQYYECDIDTAGESSRGAKRIIFSDDGLIYYTEDHYESFTLLYGEE